MAAGKTKKVFVQFDADIWLTDTAMLSPLTKGVWIDMLMWMHAKKTATITGTVEKLARAFRCSVSEMQFAVTELKNENVADVTEMLQESNGKVTEMLQESYGDVTEEISITCRRMKRAENERVRIKEAVKKTKLLRKSNGDVTEMLQESNGKVTEGDSDLVTEMLQQQEEKENKDKEKVSPTPPLKDKENKEKEEFIPPTLNAQARAHEEDRYPSSAPEIQALARTAIVALPCSEEQADNYFVTRVAANWYDANNNKIEPNRVAYDLKKWLLRDQNENRKNKGQYKNGRTISRNAEDYGVADAV